MFANRLTLCETPDGSHSATGGRSWKQFLAAMGLALALLAAPADALGGTRRAPRLLAVLIGGMDSDPTEDQIAGRAGRREGNSGLYRLAGDLEGTRVTAEYFNWNGSRAGRLKLPAAPGTSPITGLIREHLQRHPADRVAIVGNSWGGHTAHEVALALVNDEAPLALDLVVFLDAASTGRAAARPRELSRNVRRCVSYFTRNIFVWGRFEGIARLENIDLGDPARGYMNRLQPAYHRSFDWQAHVAAEWDENIHADIERRLLALLPEE